MERNAHASAYCHLESNADAVVTGCTNEHSLVSLANHPRVKHGAGRSRLTDGRCTPRRAAAACEALEATTSRVRPEPPTPPRKSRESIVTQVLITGSDIREARRPLISSSELFVVITVGSR